MSRKIAILVVLGFSLSSAMQAADTIAKPGASVTIWQARRTVIEGLEATNRYYAGLHIASYSFTLDTLEIDTSNHEHFSVDLKSIPSVYTGQGFGVRCFLKTREKTKIPAPLNKWAVDCANGPESDALYAIANTFVAAVIRLRAAALNADEPLRTFPQQAAAWRALASKPPIPEDVRVQRLLAEDAVKNNKPDEALFRYQTGLQLCPVWPEGNFNAALVAAQLGFYGEAVEHMQAYLDLVPNATDAQAARDQISIWKYKASEAKSK